MSVTTIPSPIAEALAALRNEFSSRSKVGTQLDDIIVFALAQDWAHCQYVRTIDIVAGIGMPVDEDFKRWIKEAFAAKSSEVLKQIRRLMHTKVDEWTDAWMNER